MERTQRLIWFKQPINYIKSFFKRIGYFGWFQQQPLLGQSVPIGTFHSTHAAWVLSWWNLGKFKLKSGENMSWPHFPMTGDSPLICQSPYTPFFHGSRSSISSSKDWLRWTAQMLQDPFEKYQKIRSKCWFLWTDPCYVVPKKTYFKMAVFFNEDHEWRWQTIGLLSFS